MIPKRYNLTELSYNIVLVQEVMNMYEDQRMSLEEIALATKITRNTIRKMLIENGVKLRTKNSR